MTKTQQRKIEVIPQGYYPVTRTKAETKTGEYSVKEKSSFDFGDNRELLTWASGTFSNKRKLYRWVQNAIFSGQSVPESYNLDTAKFNYRLVVLQQALRQNTYGVFNKVEDILPVNIGLKQPAQPVSTPTAPKPKNLFQDKQLDQGISPEMKDVPNLWADGDVWEDMASRPWSGKGRLDQSIITNLF